MHGYDLPKPVGLFVTIHEGLPHVLPSYFILTITAFGITFLVQRSMAVTEMLAIGSLVVESRRPKQAESSKRILTHRDWAEMDDIKTLVFIIV